jgi:hypothetical protein
MAIVRKLPIGYYVYTITVDGVVRYIGKGKDLRLYCHMKEVRSRLNRDYRLQNIGSRSEHAENVELMAEVGMQVEAKRKCAKPGCNNPVPRWRKGRRVSKRARFCDRHSPHSRKILRQKRELDPKGQVQAAE